MKSEAKTIAFRVIKHLCGGGNGHHTSKYFYPWQVLTLVKDHTTDPQLVKDSYNQIRRALNKLGFT